MLGYRCIFSESNYRGTASALEPMIVCKIDKSVINDFIDSDANFAKELLKRMGREIAAAENHHHSFCKKNVRERRQSFCLYYKKKHPQTSVTVGVLIYQ